MTLKKSPKLQKCGLKKCPKNSYSETLNFKFLKEFMALRFLKINEFLDTVDKLYMSGFFAIRRCKPRKTSKRDVKMHPETHQNLTISMPEKTQIFGIDFGSILTSKMTPK